MKKRFGYLLALCLLLSASPAAFAAGGPGLAYEPAGAGGVRLSAENLDGHVYGAQVDLVLDGEYPNASFTPQSAGAYAPPCQAEVSGGRTTVHIYLVPDAASPLGGDGRAQLGVLDAGEPFVMPGSARLTLLDPELQPYDGADNTLVRLRELSQGSSDPGSSGNTGNTGSSGGSEDRDDTPSSYRVSVKKTEHGTVRTSPERAQKGETVTVYATPGSGYVLDSLTVRDDAGKLVELRELGNGVYAFTMPRGKVELEAKFRLQEPPAGTVSGGTAPAFLDVAEHDWFREAVDYVCTRGLMNGTGDQRFTPGGTTTRGMIVTILHRLEGSPAAGAAPFGDVPRNAYYSGAVAWAASSGVVSGYGDGRFGPDDLITREQMALILFRYAQYKGYGTEQRADLSGYGDAGQISSYALEAVQWANAAGLINGTGDGALSPDGSAPRAQAAAILMRFCENVAVS